MTSKKISLATSASGYARPQSRSCAKGTDDSLRSDRWAPADVPCCRCTDMRGHAAPDGFADHAGPAEGCRKLDPAAAVESFATVPAAVIRVRGRDGSSARRAPVVTVSAPVRRSARRSMRLLSVNALALGFADASGVGGATGIDEESASFAIGAHLVRLRFLHFVHTETLQNQRVIFHDIRGVQ